MRSGPSPFQSVRLMQFIINVVVGDFICFPSSLTKVSFLLNCEVKLLLLSLESAGAEESDMITDSG